MKIIFSPHAKLRMKQRNIGKSIVLNTIHSPDDIVTDDKGKSFIGKFHNSVLKIPFKKRRNDIIVKTVYFIKK